MKTFFVKNKKILLETAVIAVIIGCEILFFRKAFRTSLLFGDHGDGRFNNLLMEYWYKFFCGQCGINDLPCFFPASDVLGYSDVMLGFGMLYSIFRAFGCDMFLAQKITLMLVHALGVCSAYLLLRELSCNRTLRLIGIAIAFWSCTNASLFIHAQLCLISVIPLIFLFILKFCKHWEAAAKKRIPYGIALVLLLGLSFLTAFYVAYFTVLLVLVIGITYVILAKCYQEFFRFVKSNLLELLFYAVLNVVWIIPFLKLYFPVFKRSGGYPSAWVLSYSPRWYDIVRNTSTFRLEQNISNALPAGESSEVVYGFTLLILLLFIASMLFLSHCKKRSAFAGSKTAPTAYQLAKACGLCTIILYLCIVKIDDFSLWCIIKNFLPGASAIRAIGRLVGFLIIPTGICICLSLQLLTTQIRQSVGGNLHFNILTTALFLLFACLVVDTKSDFPMYWDANTYRTVLSSAAAPPDDCRIMFIYSGEPFQEGETNWNLQLDSWMLADHFHIKTLDGYSGNVPDGYNLFPMDPNYLEHAENWILANKLDTGTIYGYNYVRNTWESYDSIIARKNQIGN